MRILLFNATSTLMKIITIIILVLTYGVHGIHRQWCVETESSGLVCLDKYSSGQAGKQCNIQISDVDRNWDVNDFLDTVQHEYYGQEFGKTSQEIQEKYCCCYYPQANGRCSYDNECWMCPFWNMLCNKSVCNECKRNEPHYQVLLDYNLVLETLVGCDPSEELYLRADSLIELYQYVAYLDNQSCQPYGSSYIYSVYDTSKVVGDCGSWEYMSMREDDSIIGCQ